MDTKPYIRIIFPKCNNKTDVKIRLRFVLQLGYINNLQNSDDFEWFMQVHKLDSERLYQYYVKNKRVPYVENLILSFVDDNYVNRYVESNNNVLYVNEVALKKDWVTVTKAYKV